MLIGHKKQWQFLTKSAELRKLSHAYLFSGENQLGKRTFAFEFIKWLFGEDGWIGIQKRQHPDLVIVEPEKNEIQISQIRELIWRLSLRPFISPFKSAILDQAHLMNQEAQNCFLKTLEEPKGKTILILITEYPEMLFPTILSRVQKIKFYPVPSTEIENYLKTQAIEEREVKEIAEISQGRPGIAVDFISNFQKLKERQELIKDLIKLTNSGLSARFQYVKELAKKINLKEILNIWLSYFRNILLSKLSENQKISDTDINRLKQIQKINFLISTTNVNPRLAMEILMLELPFQGGTLEE